MQDPDRQLGGAFGTLTLRELYVGLALLGAMSRDRTDRNPGIWAEEEANAAIAELGDGADAEEVST